MWIAALLEDSFVRIEKMDAIANKIFGTIIKKLTFIVEIGVKRICNALLFEIGEKGTEMSCN